MDMEELAKQFKIPPGKQISLTRDHDPALRLESLTKAAARSTLEEGIKLLAEYQDRLYAQNTYALLVILQAMDAAGKDGTIKHVMSGLNPQGCQVCNFKAPSEEELDHDYLWRCSKALPERGTIGIFNRSYYEEVLVARVHPEVLERQQLPPETRDKSIWKRRFQEINNFESYLVDNGIVVLKFFLNVSKDEQKKRFLERIDLPEKNWKFSISDARDRAFWDDYIKAYEDCLSNTNTKWAPWHIIPADHKPFTRLAVAYFIYQKLKELDVRYPKITREQRQQLLEAKHILESEE